MSALSFFNSVRYQLKRTETRSSLVLIEKPYSRVVPVGDWIDSPRIVERWPTGLKFSDTLMCGLISKPGVKRCRYFGSCPTRLQLNVRPTSLGRGFPQANVWDGSMLPSEA